MKRRSLLKMEKSRTNIAKIKSENQNMNLKKYTQDAEEMSQKLK